MSVREIIVNLMICAGYDSFTAGERADDCVSKFTSSTESATTFGIRGGGSFTLKKRIAVPSTVN